MSWGEHSNGPKKEQGPPDLDEIFKKFSQKLTQLFSGKIHI